MNTREVKTLPLLAEFISDSQDVAHLKNYIGSDAEEYDSFFVIVLDGEYTDIWGMHGTVPYMSKHVTKIRG